MRPLHHRVLPTTLEDSILGAYVPRLLSVACAQFQRAGRDTAYCRRNTESTIIKLWRPMAALEASPLPFGIGVRSLCTPASSPRCGLPACLTRMVKSEQCLQSAVHCVLWHVSLPWMRSAGLCGRICITRIPVKSAAQLLCEYPMISRRFRCDEVASVPSAFRM